MGQKFTFETCFGIFNLVHTWSDENHEYFYNIFDTNNQFIGEFYTTETPDDEDLFIQDLECVLECLL